MGTIPGSYRGPYRHKGPVTDVSEYPEEVLLSEACPLFADLAPTFDSGVPLEPEDHVRLGKQLARILEVMGDGQWRTLRQIEEATGYGQASISAQLRNARKRAHGSHQVDREHLGHGLYQYRLAR